MQAEAAPGHHSSPELCLDFTDTVDWRTSSHAKDTIASYFDLLDWSLRKGLVDGEERKRLASMTEDNQKAARKVLSDAYQLREGIYRIFSAIAHERKADPRDIDLLNEHLARSLGKLKVGSEGTGYAWGWRETESPDMMLWPIARSAADLLTSAELGRVRECANEEEGCGSLFLDYSKSQTKRWCSMESCGNRMKFKTYYARHKKPSRAPRARSHAT